VSDPAIKLLTTLFDPADLILFRPVETWTENGRKRSRVDYQNAYYRRASEDSLTKMLPLLRNSSSQENTNLFFGVCPRLGDAGRFDLAWQIRTVRFLWADVDHCSVDEVKQRCHDADVPEPTAIVDSGNGVHLYWKLKEAFQIDDADAPQPVETEWITSPDGTRKSRRYIDDAGDRVYLDRRHYVTKVSPKAMQVQNQLSGIAEAISGDHTTDLSRLLRLPGTLNRKDQRNGHEPVMSTLVELEPNRQYSIEDFSRFAKSSDQSQKEEKIAAMPLPCVRKATPAKCDKLSELIARCSIAQSGQRSEADFSVCCYAVRQGISKEEVWPRVQTIGKFAEQGRRYFDRTWENAEYDVRVTLCEKLQQKMASELSAAEVHDVGEADAEGESHTISINPKTTPVASTMGQITDRLLSTGCCFNRIGQLVVIRNENIDPVLSSAELTGLLNQHVEFKYISHEGAEYKPLSPIYANTWLNNATQRERLPTVKLYSHSPIYTDDWRLLKPGYDEESGFYYAGPEIKPIEGTKHLDKLLLDFCWKEPADRTNYIGILLTGLLVSRFLGSKPAALFNGNQPELGKSVLAQILAILRDGQPVETASYNANDEEFEKRLGAIVRRGVTTIVIDNAKARGKRNKIDSACLERSITDPILSFRLLGFSQEIRAENSHQFCITANSPDVSRDLITRSVIINLHHEGDPRRRAFSMNDPEGYVQKHRVEILGELVNMVEHWKFCGMPRAEVHTRFNKRGWGQIIGGILFANKEPDFMDNAEEAATEMDDTRREFDELVTILANHPQGLWTSSELVDLATSEGLLRADIGDGTPRSRSTRMGILAGRFVNDRFSVGEQATAIFRRHAEGRLTSYRVAVEEPV